MKKGFLSTIFLPALLLLLSLPALAAEGDITVYYTNDIHTYIDNHLEEGQENGLTYSKVAALKASTENAILVDAGDHIQGSIYGGMDKGATIISLMNEAGYDAATPGNHEFDYGIEGCMAAVAAARYPYVSCNFYHESNGIPGRLVLDSYTLVEAGGKQVAFVGICTPQTILSTPSSFFQDGAGNYIYGIAGGTDGAALFSYVQTAIDQARAAGADYVIALGHLGVESSTYPWTSLDVIANTTGLDAFIDGHSHTSIPGKTVPDREGRQILLTQTGSYLEAVGRLTISPDGTVSSSLLTGEDLAHLTPDARVKAIEDSWIARMEASMGEAIGYAQVTLDNFDAQGNRLVRQQSTNTGDFTADALYALFDRMGLEVDMAMMHGGGIRNTAITGPLSYLDLVTIHPFGNVACLITVSGQQLLDALEWGTVNLRPDGTGENGSFLHVSGLRYTVDATIPSTVRYDEKKVWIGGPTGPYRVRDVQVLDRESGLYLPLDLTAHYNMAGHSYTLRDLGDGFAMFEDAVLVLDYVADDITVLADYVRSFPVDAETGLPTITAAHGYGDVEGSGRITLITAPEEPPRSTYVTAPGDCLWTIAHRIYGDGSKWTLIHAANRDSIRNPNLILVGQTLLIPVP